MEPGPGGVKREPVEFTQKLNSKVRHSGRLLSFDHWPLKQNLIISLYIIIYRPSEGLEFFGLVGPPDRSHV